MNQITKTRTISKHVILILQSQFMKIEKVFLVKFIWIGMYSKIYEFFIRNG